MFEIDQEFYLLLDKIEQEIEARGEASAVLMERFQDFCIAHGEKADRIGRFLRMMEARVQYCRSEAARLQDRARICDRKVTQTKFMVMYYPKSRNLKKIEGREFYAANIEEQSGFRSVHKRNTGSDEIPNGGCTHQTANLGTTEGICPR